MGALTGNNYMQLHHFFEESVKNYPNNIALICDNAFISYQELENRSNQLAHYLYSQNIRKKGIVGILLERSVECYIAILAILKIGAVYVPIESEYPNERINYIFSDLTFDAVLTSSYQLAQKNVNWPQVFALDTLSSIISAQPTDASYQEQLDEDNSCYIIYTSGSTGKPKGVEITHKNITHYVNEASKLYEMSQNDTVYQGFSLAFDASLEEVWMAFANAATLIACTDKEIRSGLGLISFLKQHQVTFFSTVPTLLASLDVDDTLPQLRLLILGGETCSSSLIKRWYRPGLKIMNTYGPTEATVVTTFFECFPNEDVTIGKPLSGYEVFIVDDQLNEVPCNEIGELCIAGPSLARGYVNKPDSTREKFVYNPRDSSQRWYRTGDLVSKDTHGNLHFSGRVDEQIKLRGFRIELSEIESLMKEYPGISQAVVALQTIDQPTLIGYIILDRGKPFDLDEFKVYLRNNLPDYMIPSGIELLESFPLLTSGKINKKALPKPESSKTNKSYTAPGTDLEKEISRVLEKIMDCSSVSVDADFFYDLGGHSLLAAKVISSLRHIPKLKNISILDLYKHPTIAQLAKKFAHSHHSTEEPPPREKYRAPQWKYYLCGIAQLFGVVFQYALSTWQILAVALLYTFNASGWSLISREGQLGLFALFLLLPVISVAIPVSLKWLLLGKVKPGQYRLWGWFYFRWWLVHQLLRTLYLNKYLSGTPLIRLYYRLLGAKIGKNCHIGTMLIGIPDLLTIGDHCSIGIDVKLNGYKIEDGWLKIGSIDLGAHAYIGSRSVIGIDTQVEEYAVLEEMSMVPDTVLIPKGSYCAGSPAVISTLPADHITRNVTEIQGASMLENTCFGILHYLSIEFLTIMYTLCFLPSAALIMYFYDKGSYLTTLLFAVPIGAMLFLSLHYLSIIICKKIVLDKVKPGRYPIRSLYYFRYWFVAKMLDENEIFILSDSLYMPMFMRLLGAKLGKQVEMGESPHIIPDLVTIKDGGFSASAVAMAWPKVYRDCITYAPVTVGEKGFLGNFSVLPGDKNIGDGGLLGTLSIAPENNQSEEPNTAWLGSPAVFLPKRELFVGYSDKQTYNPSKLLYGVRLTIEFFRIIIPTLFSLIILFNLIVVMNYMVPHASLAATGLTLLMTEFFSVIGLTAVLIGLKWILLGRLKPLTKPIWDIFIWKNDIIEYSFNYFMCPYFVELALGTPFAFLIPRCLGTKVGKRAYTDTVSFSEFDLISIGDNVCLNSDVTIQTHLYEDRIFKVSHVVIESGCNVGVGSIVLYNTLMEEHATLGNLSLLMKGERLPANTEWAGIPAQSTLISGQLHPLPHSENVIMERDSGSHAVPEY